MSNKLAITEACSKGKDISIALSLFYLVVFLWSKFIMPVNDLDDLEIFEGVLTEKLHNVEQTDEYHLRLASGHSNYLIRVRKEYCENRKLLERLKTDERVVLYIDRALSGIYAYHIEQRGKVLMSGEHVIAGYNANHWKLFYGFIAFAIMSFAFYFGGYMYE